MKLRAAVAFATTLGVIGVAGLGADAPTGGPTAHADSPVLNPLQSVLDALAEERVEDAARVVAELPAARVALPDAILARGLVAFEQGRYQEALGLVDQAIAVLPDDLAGIARNRRPPIAAAARRTREFESLSSPDGRYVIRFGRSDRILAPYALAHLRASDERLTEILGYRHPGPIRVEFYDDIASLAEVSTLSEEAIETTGTIAICKFDRLMMTTPRVLGMGYAWARTLSHELTHLLLTRATRDHAPVWFHEGVAKFLESSPYFGRPVLTLDAYERKTLHDRLLAGTLLPFERFYPSVAMLPTAEDASLAYAEASTVMAAFYARMGVAGFQTLVTRVAAREEPRAAMAALLGEDFERFARASYEPARRFVLDPDIPLGRRLPGDEEEKPRSPSAARHVRLGDMLWARGRSLAASREYARAAAVEPRDPVVLSRLGRSALEGGDAAAALQAAERALALRPEHAPALALRALAFARLDRRPEAVLAAYDALRYNPFDPAPHCVLAQVSPDTPTRERERAFCQDLDPEGNAVP